MGDVRSQFVATFILHKVKHLGSESAIMATFLLEVGTEELPANFVGDALEQWRSLIPKSLDEQYLTPTEVEFYGTPRRLAVLIQGLPARQPDQDEEIKGPPAQAAFKDGKPTKAAEGFANKQGVSLDDLEIRPTEKGEFVFVRKTTVGRPTSDLLAELVPQWIGKLDGKRFMRWANGDFRFSRPIRWLVALLDADVLPITVENGQQGFRSDRISRGHRVLHPAPVEIRHAETYVKQLSDASVQVVPAQRQSLIQQQVEAAAAKLGGVARISPDLLEEVTNLVEYPSVVVGKFDAEFLELPSEVAITEMESHQRYFPVLNQAKVDELLPYFITVSNGDPAKADIIAAGNERVIRARLSDGKFFFDADRAHGLESYLPRLETVTFQEALGSVRAKVDRIGNVADLVAKQLQVAAAELSLIQRAALLCKADLVTQMVGEFPELQGVMGQKYALASGEPVAVADAIFEHYLPRGAGDRLPRTLTGQVVGIADRLDTLVSIFGLGMIPSGSSDPFALRRAANAVINISWAANLSLNLNHLLQQTVSDFANLYGEVMKLKPDELQAQLQDFFLQRIRTLLQDDLQIDYDLVNAVLGEQDAEYSQRALEDLLDVRDRAQFLQSIRADGQLEAIYATVNRASRLAAQGNLDTATLDPAAVIQPKRFQKSSEQGFYDALVQLQARRQQTEVRDYAALVTALAEIAPTVSEFFDGETSVLVMDENLEIRQNRLNLLSILRNHARVLADFGAIVKS